MSYPLQCNDRRTPRQGGGRLIDLSNADLGVRNRLTDLPISAAANLIVISGLFGSANLILILASFTGQITVGKGIKAKE